jgi:hypothetical protein
MTPRSFWTLLIKITGFYVVVESLVAIPQFLSSMAIFYKQAQSETDNSYLIFVTGYFAMLIAIYVSILRFCLFKTDIVIDKLKLDQGYQDERFEFNIHRSTILKIIVIVMGGLLIIDSFPVLLQHVLTYLQQSHDVMYKNFTDGPVAKFIILYFIKTSIGVFMLTSSRLVVNFIEFKRKGTIE